ncbi:MAG: hypothetical protein CMI00_12340 [Oceanospirillaceae bacterium]|nr:hypothetical protein [Oceanospirillaceae bacterium]
MGCVDICQLARSVLRVEYVIPWLLRPAGEEMTTGYSGFIEAVVTGDRKAIQSLSDQRFLFWLFPG